MNEWIESNKDVSDRTTDIQLQPFDDTVRRMGYVLLAEAIAQLGGKLLIDVRDLNSMNQQGIPKICFENHEGTLVFQLVS